MAPSSVLNPGGERGVEGRRETPVPDWESENVATLKVTMI